MRIETPIHTLYLYKTDEERIEFMEYFGDKLEKESYRRIVTSPNKDKFICCFINNGGYVDGLKFKSLSTSILNLRGYKKQGLIISESLAATLSIETWNDTLQGIVVPIRDEDYCLPMDWHTKLPVLIFKTTKHNSKVVINDKSFLDVSDGGYFEKLDIQNLKHDWALSDWNNL